MSEKLFRFLLSELTTIRIRCKNGECSGVLEMNADSFSQLHKPLSCPVCGIGYTGKSGQLTALESFGKSIELVKGQGERDKFQIEFVVPDLQK